MFAKTRRNIPGWMSTDISVLVLLIVVLVGGLNFWSTPAHADQATRVYLVDDHPHAIKQWISTEPSMLEPVAGGSYGNEAYSPVSVEDHPVYGDDTLYIGNEYAIQSKQSDRVITRTDGLEIQNLIVSPDRIWYVVVGPNKEWYSLRYRKITNPLEETATYTSTGWIGFTPYTHQGENAFLVYNSTYPTGMVLNIQGTQLGQIILSKPVNSAFELSNGNLIISLVEGEEVEEVVVTNHDGEQIETLQERLGLESKVTQAAFHEDQWLVKTADGTILIVQDETLEQTIIIQDERLSIGDITTVEMPTATPTAGTTSVPTTTPLPTSSTSRPEPTTGTVIPTPSTTPTPTGTAKPPEEGEQLEGCVVSLAEMNDQHYVSFWDAQSSQEVRIPLVEDDLWYSNPHFYNNPYTGKHELLLIGYSPETEKSNAYRVVFEDGAARVIQLTYFDRVYDAQWWNDRSIIVAGKRADEENTSLFIVPTDGTGISSMYLTRVFGQEVTFARKSGSEIVYSQRTVDIAGANDLFWLDISEQLLPTPLTHTPNRMEVEPAFAPLYDRSLIAYIVREVGTSNIYLMDPTEPDGAFALTTEESRTQEGHNLKYVRDFSWYPYVEKAGPLVFSGLQKGSNTYNLFIIGIDGKDIQRIPLADQETVHHISPHWARFSCPDVIEDVEVIPQPDNYVSTPFQGQITQIDRDAEGITLVSDGTEQEYMQITNWSYVAFRLKEGICVTGEVRTFEDGSEEVFILGFYPCEDTDPDNPEDPVENPGDNPGENPGDNPEYEPGQDSSGCLANVSGKETRTHIIIFRDMSQGSVVHEYPIDAQQLSWSPDRRYLVYTTNWNRSGDQLLRVLDLQTGKRTTILTGNLIKHPSWSPNGDRILFERDGSIETIRPDGTDLTTLQLSWSAYSPSWYPLDSGDEEKYDVLFLLNGSLHKGSSTTGEEEKLSIESIEDQEINNIWSPRYSPDGEQIAFIGSKQSGGQPQIYLVDKDGSNLRVLTELDGQGYDHMYEVHWSPDGQFLVFRGEYAGTSTLYIIRVDDPLNVMSLGQGLSSADWTSESCPDTFPDLIVDDPNNPDGDEEEEASDEEDPNLPGPILDPDETTVTTEYRRVCELHEQRKVEGPRYYVGLCDPWGDPTKYDYINVVLPHGWDWDRFTSEYPLETCVVLQTTKYGQGNVLEYQFWKTDSEHCPVPEPGTEAPTPPDTNPPPHDETVIIIPVEGGGNPDNDETDDGRTVYLPIIGA